MTRLLRSGMRMAEDSEAFRSHWEVIGAARKKAWGAIAKADMETRDAFTRNYGEVRTWIEKACSEMGFAPVTGAMLNILLRMRALTHRSAENREVERAR